MRVAISFFAFTILTVVSWGQNALPNPRPPYAPHPTDRYWEEQWYFDHRGEDGIRFGPDINVRGAWERTRGEGVIIAIANDAVDLAHRDLAANQVPEFHYDFERNETNGSPLTFSDNRGTPQIGLAVAALNNVGIVGVAPAAKFAAWKIVRTNNVPDRFVIDAEKMAAAFAYQNQSIAVQLHTWIDSKTGYRPYPLSEVESQAISNAVTLGRNGKGVVIVRPAGNAFYPDFRGVNDDATISDPRLIAVGAVRADGRTASYSQRGPAVLVAAVSGDFNEGYPNLFTTDRTGSDVGFNSVIIFPSDPMLSDYVWGNLRNSNTTDASSQVAGLCALILSANPNLTYRDVQQILIHSSRHFDKSDPDLHRNAAGYWVSHKQGFGIPDAGEAVRLADHWQNRPAMVRRTIPSDILLPIDIPDSSLRVYLTDQSSQPPLNRSFSVFPSIGLHPDDPTAELPLVDVGMATNTLPDLAGKAALIEDPEPTGDVIYRLSRVIAAGASFAVVFNSSETPNVLFDWITQRLDFTPIPVVLVPSAAGPVIKSYITNQTALRAQLRTTPAIARFGVNEAMLVEHVGVRVRTSHPSRQDLRITLVSPQGTRSIMQTINSDQTAGPVDWTYYSVQHYYELSSGVWTLEVTDEVQDLAGQLLGAELIVEGVPILDLDDDGLDDTWEIAHFTTLAQGGLDDPDNDGSWNAREQILGTNPKLDQTVFKLVTSIVQSNAVRVAFPSIEGTNYVIQSTTNLNSPLQNIGTFPGSFGETEIITDMVEPHRFFQIRK